MIINHNIAALNTHRQLSMGSTAASKNMEKLSSGLKINRAGDDAAGLAISEKMRAQIRGLDMASKNAQDGISLIQTAEGALNETHAILQRMRELAVQAGNDTNADSDRAEIQKEINQLTSEINRISNTTEFNTKKLLNGGVEDIAVTTTTPGKVATYDPAPVKGVYEIDLTGLATGESVTIDGGTAINWTTDIETTIKAIQADTTISGNYDIQVNGNKVTFTQKVASDTALAFDSTNNTVKGQFEVKTTGVTGTEKEPGTEGVYSFKLDTSELRDGQKIVIDDETYVYNGEGANGFKDLTELADNIAASGKYTASVGTDEKSITLTQVTASEDGPKVSKTTGDGESFKATLQIGANKNQTMQLDIGNMSASKLGLVGTTVTEGLEVTNGTNNVAVGSALNVLDHDSAADAVKIINDAIEKVSAERSKLGAFQNRLEHTINNLGTSSENLTAAESRIRDVDMAKEMMEFTKNNILTQASQAMLAQANQQPQGVLQLLR
ncbi:flagellin [Bacillus chungangensis]|uniref:Flagellin n=1 Tax=Bacillus chungangensis TaxID=587633 RepID=A0ABT9WUU8_9BACI|nr:flagellin [Bacillus chungangensis]MDQ0177082.1 flagellin [Bacillus chungangensis]